MIGILLAIVTLLLVAACLLLIDIRDLTGSVEKCLRDSSFTIDINEEKKEGKQ